MYVHTCIYIHTWYLRCHKSKSSNTYIHYFDECAVCPFIEASKIRRDFFDDLEFFLFFEVLQVCFDCYPDREKKFQIQAQHLGEGIFFLDLHGQLVIGVVFGCI